MYRSVTFIIFLAGSALLIFTYNNVYQPPHVQHKHTYSVDTSGGNKGRIIKVVNLNNKGTGSLRWAVEQSGARKIVFEVGGVIDLDRKSIKITEPFISILGETAPSPGITLIKGGVRVTTHHVNISHMMIRPGDAGQEKRSGWNPGGITIYGEHARDILIDHCSITWAVDDNVAVSGPPDLGPEKTSGRVIIRNSIIAEGLSDSSHPKGPHSKGMLVHNNAQNVSVINNLFAHNTAGNPYFKANTIGVIKGNIIYNPKRNAIQLSAVKPTLESPPPKLSIVSNLLIHGNDTKPKLNLVRKHGLLYLNDNHVAKDAAGHPIGETWDGMGYLLKMPIVHQDGIDLLDTTIQDDFCQILNQAGARPWDPNDIDLRIKKSVLDRSGKIIDSQNDVGGYPKYQPTQQVFMSQILTTNNFEAKVLCQTSKI
ncbi:MAG: pectate lyase [Alteromonadaceae bacterium]|nr:MAG: pectate lyase [Alteromonadaceae bacterium]